MSVLLSFVSHCLVCLTVTSQGQSQRTAKGHFQHGITKASVEQESTTRRKRRRGSSSDSSLLESLRKQRPKARNSPVREDVQMDYQELSSSERPPTRRSVTRPIPREIYEKRPRHKTREDRYEPKSRSRTIVVDCEKGKLRPKRVKQGDRKKQAQQRGSDLVQNFSSKNIGSERLTVSGTEPAWTTLN